MLRFCYHHRMNCQVGNCNRPIQANGYCSTHYWRSRHGVDLDAPIGSLYATGRQTCIADDCDELRVSDGLCSLHHSRHRAGIPLDKPKHVHRAEVRLQRLWRNMEVDGAGCWLYTGKLNAEGYCNNNRHRIVYELVNGPIPEGLELDHLCNVRHCCNPDHLEPVTQAVNAARAAERHEVCPNGHVLAETGVYTGKEHGKPRRRCAACAREATRRYKRKKAVTV